MLQTSQDDSDLPVKHLQSPKIDHLSICDQDNESDRGNFYDYNQENEEAEEDRDNFELNFYATKNTQPRNSLKGLSSRQPRQRFIFNADMLQSPKSNMP